MTNPDLKSPTTDTFVVIDPDTCTCVVNTIPVTLNTTSTSIAVDSRPNLIESKSRLVVKKSSVICKICHFGDESEQLVQPCFCKGNRFYFFVIGGIGAKTRLV